MATHQCIAKKQINVYEKCNSLNIIKTIEPEDVFCVCPGSYNANEHHFLFVYYADNRIGHLMPGMIEFDVSSFQIVGTRLSTESLLHITGKPNTTIEMVEPNSNIQPIGYPEPFIGMITITGETAAVYRKPNTSADNVATVYAWDRYPYYASDTNSSNESWLYVFINPNTPSSGSYGWIQKSMLEIDY